MVEPKLSLSISDEADIRCTELIEWTPTRGELAEKFRTPVISSNKLGVKYIVRAKGNKRKDSFLADTASVLVLDCDSRITDDGGFISGAPPFNEVTNALKLEGIPFIAHSTYSNSMETPKYRILIPCEYHREDLVTHLDYVFSLLHMQGVRLHNVKENSAWAQAWFMPSVPNEAALKHYQYKANLEGTLDMQAAKNWLRTRPEAPLDAPESLPQARKPFDTSDGKRSPIDEFNQQHTTAHVLLRNGYQQKGKSFLAPDSTTQVAGVNLCKNCVDGVERVYSHHGSDPLNDGFAHDAFDCYRILECGGDDTIALQWSEDITKHNQRLYMQSKEQAASQAIVLSDAAKRLAKNIEKNIINALDIPIEDQDEFLKKLYVKKHVIDGIINGSFWNPQKSKVYAFNNLGALNEYKEADAYKFICKTHGSIFDYEFLSKKADEVAKTKMMTAIETEKFIGSVIAIPRRHIMDHLKYYNQRSNIEMRVDMFALKPRMDIRDESVKVVFVHKPFEVNSCANQSAVDDYKQHFTQFDEFVNFIIASRFARDRKKAYLWFWCDSDWGKGFLIGLLLKLEASVEVSVKETEMMFEGKPVGKSMTDFKRAITLIIDEFKTVKSELKQLQSEISLSPKNQLAFRVEVFAKLFFSAENVNSLVGDYGVEDQFANRISLIRGSGSVNERPIYKQLGSGAYFDAVLHYLSLRLNLGISKMIALGRKEAEIQAENFLNKFSKTYGLGNTYQRLSESISDIADDFVSQVYAVYWSPNQHHHQALENRVLGNNDKVYLQTPTKALEDWITGTTSISERFTLLKKKDDILRLISADGTSDSKIHSINGKKTRALALRPLAKLGCSYVVNG